VAGADVVITMLPDADALTSVLDHQGVLDAFAPRGAWVQMGTIGLAGAERLPGIATSAARSGGRVSPRPKRA
jgi:3-hydroxyisobutyrate dehydrogenase-like beta-hydroxyacid dehydrogenase